jgi:hypothetical protein
LQDWRLSKRRPRHASTCSRSTRGRNDLAHVSFVQEANRWFPETARTHNFRYESTSDWTRLNADSLKAYQDPIDPFVESVSTIRAHVLEAAKILPVEQLGTTDDCGFAPFADDTSTARETAFAKIRARIEGTELASRDLGA